MDTGIVLGNDDDRHIAMDSTELPSVPGGPSPGSEDRYPCPKRIKRPTAKDRMEVVNLSDDQFFETLPISLLLIVGEYRRCQICGRDLHYALETLSHLNGVKNFSMLPCGETVKLVRAVRCRSCTACTNCCICRVFYRNELRLPFYRDVSPNYWQLCRYEYEDRSYVHRDITSQYFACSHPPGECVWSPLLTTMSTREWFTASIIANRPPLPISSIHPSTS